MTDESTVLDSQPEDDCVPASIAGLIGESIVDKLRADMKPRRKWKEGKRVLLAKISDLDAILHDAQSMAATYRESRARYAATAFVLGCGLGGAISYFL